MGYTSYIKMGVPRTGSRSRRYDLLVHVYVLFTVNKPDLSLFAQTIVRGERDVKVI